MKTAILAKPVLPLLASLEAGNKMRNPFIFPVLKICSSNARGVKIYIKMYEEEFYSAYIAARLTRISRPLRGEGKNSSESTEVPCLLSP